MDGQAETTGVRGKHGAQATVCCALSKASGNKLYAPCIALYFVPHFVLVSQLPDAGRQHSLTSGFLP